MSNAIYKYTLNDVKNVIKMPKNANVLCVQTQRALLCLWAIVDTDSEMEERVFLVLPTGSPVEYDIGKYIGTAQLYDGMIVFHVFEVLGGAR